MSRPLGFGFGGGRDWLACDMALGLKPRSVGPVKEYFDGWSYRYGGSAAMTRYKTQLMLNAEHKKFLHT